MYKSTMHFVDERMKVEMNALVSSYCIFHIMQKSILEEADHLFFFETTLFIIVLNNAVWLVWLPRFVFYLPT